MTAAAGSCGEVRTCVSDCSLALINYSRMIIKDTAMEAFLIGGPMEAYATAAAFDLFHNHRRYSYEDDRSPNQHEAGSSGNSTSSRSRPVPTAHKSLLGLLRKYLCCHQPEAVKTSDVMVQLSITGPTKLNP